MVLYRSGSRKFNRGNTTLYVLVTLYEGRHGFSGWNKSSCLPTNWAFKKMLILPKAGSTTLYSMHSALCRET